MQVNQLVPHRLELRYKETQFHREAAQHHPSATQQLAWPEWPSVCVQLVLAFDAGFGDDCNVPIAMCDQTLQGLAQMSHATYAHGRCTAALNSSMGKWCAIMIKGQIHLQ